MDSSKVLDFFKEITKIPRESGHEELMASYLIDFALSHGLEHKKDKAGNVLIIKEATPGKENVPSIALQCHQDMVCEKSEACGHDFSKDPIHYEIKDGWMVAPETTLGADDGIGIAACLAILDSDLPAGRIECLFTVSEETGMDGAFALEEGFFTSKTLINLDSEDEGQLFVGCAGGVTTQISFDLIRETAAPGSSALDFRLYGTLGGHSGDDIDKGRINTVQQMARFIKILSGKMDVRLVGIDGGGKHNAIARECRARVAISPELIASAKEEFGKFCDALRAEYHRTEPVLMQDCNEAVLDVQPLERSLADRLISALVAVHHGVLAMSQDIEGLVETSSNLASVHMNGSTIDICTSQRSSVDSVREYVADKVEACFRLAGAKVSRNDPYPGWKPDMNSHILERTRSAYRRLFGTEPLVKAIHAGLECGLFLEKFKDLDMISFGPTLRGVHAPGERLDLASNEKFVKLLADVVTNFG